MSKLVAVILLVLIFVGLWWAVSSDVFRGSYSQTTMLLEQTQEFIAPTGDRIQITTETKPVPIQSSVTPIQNSTVIISPNVTLSSGEGKTYGQTEQFQGTTSNTYQIGNPVVISGKLFKVVPDSCHIQDGVQVCDYISPPKFKYLFYVTCEFRDFCNLADISRWAWTNNDGSFKETIQTPPSSFNAGMYRIDILANSEVKDPSGRPYEVKAEYYFRMLSS